ALNNSTHSYFPPYIPAGNEQIVHVLLSEITAVHGVLRNLGLEKLAKRIIRDAALALENIPTARGGPIHHSHSHGRRSTARVAPDCHHGRKGTLCSVSLKDAYA